MTLLEVLVAFVVLTLVAGVSMEIFSSGARVSVRISERERAAALAESKLTVAGSGAIETGTWQGEWEQKSWQIRVEDVTPRAFSGPEQRFALYRVKVTVNWQEHGRRSQYSLSTLRVRPAPGEMR